MNDDPRKAVDPEVAFAYFPALPPSQRRRATVADRFRTSPQRVSQIAARHGWDDRVAAIDRRARQRAETTIVRDRAREIAKTLEIVALAEDELLERLRRGDVEIRLADLPGLVKIRELLLGEATERIEASEVRVVLHAAFAVAVRYVPGEQRPEFLRELEAAVGGVVELTRPMDELEEAVE